MHPENLGYREARPDSGIWTHPERSGGFVPQVCENPACGKAFMAERRPNRPKRFCSLTCSGQSHRKPDATYGCLHERVYKSRGKASEQTCVDCGGQAQHWSQKRGTTGQDPRDYEPRCVTCHYGTGGYDDEARARGEAHSNAKLTEDQVREIRASKATNRALAAIYGVNIATISYVRTRKTWKQVA